MPHLVPLLPAFLLLFAATAAAAPVRQVDSSSERQPYGLRSFLIALESGELQGVDPAATEKANAAIRRIRDSMHADIDSDSPAKLAWFYAFRTSRLKGVGAAIAELKAFNADIPQEVVDAAAAFDGRRRRSGTPALSGLDGPAATTDAAENVTGKDIWGVASGSTLRTKDDEGDGSAVAIQFVSSLSAGSVAALLEVLAIILALLTAANLQAISSWTARRRLYYRGTVCPRDSTRNLGIADGFSKPGILLRDFRALLAFLFALFIVVLEVLTVLQTQPGDSCTFDDSSTWKIEKSAELCFSNATEVEPHSNSEFSYMPKAETMMERVDLEQGIPVNTNTFEDSIISGKAVKQLKDENYEDRYTAPVFEVADVFGNVTTNGHTFLDVLLGKVEGSFGYVGESCSTADSKDIAVDSAAKLINNVSYFPTNFDYPDYKENKSTTKSSSTGFLRISSCRNVLLALTCAYDEGRIIFEEESSLGNDPTSDDNRWKDDRYPVQCKFVNVSRENRRTNPSTIVSAIIGSKRIDADSIRRALLATVIAQNSAINVPCKRYLAVPKRCTQIGWISVGAISSLLLVFFASSLFRLALSLASRDLANYNGSPKRWSLAVFDHLDGSESKASHTLIKSRKRDTLLRRRLNDNEIQMSVAKSSNGPYSHHLVMARGPIADPATYIPGSAIAPLASAVAETDADASEVTVVN